MILHWAVSFLSGNSASPVALIVLFVAAICLIGFNDWYIVNRKAQRDSRVETLEALFALKDHRVTGHTWPKRPR